MHTFWLPSRSENPPQSPEALRSSGLLSILHCCPSPEAALSPHYLCGFQSHRPYLSDYPESLPKHRSPLLSKDSMNQTYFPLPGMDIPEPAAPYSHCRRLNSLNPANPVSLNLNLTLPYSLHLDSLNLTLPYFLRFYPGSYLLHPVPLNRPDPYFHLRHPGSPASPNPPDPCSHPLYPGFPVSLDSTYHPLSPDPSERPESRSRSPCQDSCFRPQPLPRVFLLFPPIRSDIPALLPAEPYALLPSCSPNA